MNIGFLGLGNMGQGMAGCLLDAGHSLTLYNRTADKARALVERGATLADSPRLAATDADLVIAMVGDDGASRQVWLSEDGALAAMNADAIVVECSTLSADWVSELSTQVKSRGLSYLDTPVTGLPTAAAAGLLTLFLGGDDATIERAQPALVPLSEKQIRFGDIGAGTAYKLIVNLMGSIQILSAAEGMVVAERAGLDPALVADALATGGAGSPTVARVVGQMVAGQFDKEVVFSALWRLKDTRYGADFSKKMNLESELANHTEELFQQVLDAGFGDQGESKVIDIVRKS